MNQSNMPKGSTNNSNMQFNIYQQSVNNSHQSKYPSNVQQSNKYQQSHIMNQNLTMVNLFIQQI